MHPLSTKSEEFGAGPARKNKNETFLKPTTRILQPTMDDALSTLEETEVFSRETTNKYDIFANNNGGKSFKIIEHAGDIAVPQYSWQKSNYR